MVIVVPLLPTYLAVNNDNWNEYLFALNFTNNGTYTLPVGIVNISQTEFTTNFGILSAAMIMLIVPLVILTLLLERRKHLKDNVVYDYKNDLNVPPLFVPFSSLC